MEDSQKYIVLPFSIQKHFLCADPKFLCWWIDLVVTCSQDSHTEFINGKTVKVEHGEMVTSIRNLCFRWNTNRYKLEVFFNELVADKMVAIEVGHKLSHIKVCNLESYTMCSANGLATGFKGTATNQPSNKPQIGHTNKSESIICDDLFANEQPINEPQNGQHIASARKEKESNIKNKEKNVPLSKEEKEKYCMTPDEFKELFNQMCPSFSKVTKLSEKRKKEIRLRLLEMGSVEVVKEVFSKMENCNDHWLSKTTWCNFDFILKNDNNWLKVYEGAYNKAFGITRPEVKVNKSVNSEWE